ncbi:MAG TPA: hypothetical protein ENI62_03780 [Gammaproteobacteria bacterium]|nr:hypothetical protein [Gammaproteobacteria bacterium]
MRTLLLCGALLWLITYGSWVVAANLPSGYADFKRECSDCHMPFPPQMLPQRSWKQLLSHLDQHFNADASLDAKATSNISNFLQNYAADSANGGRLGYFISHNIAAGETPLRITDTRGWRRIHGEIRPSAWTSDKVKTRSNCLACHR